MHGFKIQEHLLLLQLYASSEQTSWGGGSYPSPWKAVRSGACSRGCHPEQRSSMELLGILRGSTWNMTYDVSDSPLLPVITEDLLLMPREYEETYFWQSQELLKQNLICPTSDLEQQGQTSAFTISKLIIDLFLWDDTWSTKTQCPRNFLSIKMTSVHRVKRNR